MTDERKAYQKAYRAAHRDEIREYTAAHRDEAKAYGKEYYKAHKALKKEYHEAHKDELKAYREAHKTEAKAYHKFYRKQQYCCEDISQIENYALAKADNFISWDIHHRLETHNSDGERRPVDITSKELKKLEMYYNRPASELIFIKHNIHRRLHSIKRH